MGQRHHEKNDENWQFLWLSPSETGQKKRDQAWPSRRLALRTRKSRHWTNDSEAPDGLKPKHLEMVI